MKSPYESPTSTRPPGAPHATAGRTLLAIAALTGALAALISFSAVAEAGAETRMVEIWRQVGLATFAGLFALLAYRPQQYAGVWELVILNNLILTVAALSYGSGAENAGTVAVADGILAIALIAAYVMCRAWQAWTAWKS